MPRSEPLQNGEDLRLQVALRKVRDWERRRGVGASFDSGGAVQGGEIAARRKEKENENSFPTDGHRQAYIEKVMQNFLNAHLRRKKIVHIVRDSDTRRQADDENKLNGTETIPSAENSASEIEMTDAIQLIQKFAEPEFFRILVIYRGEGNAWSEIAEELGKSEDACRQQYYRGLEDLRKKLNKYMQENGSDTWELFDLSFES